VKGVQIALIESGLRAFQRAIDEPCTLPLSPPKGGTKRDFAIFSSKFQLLSKRVCYKVCWCENFQRQSCSYIIPLSKRPSVHRWIAGDVPVYQKFALKVTHRCRKRWFRQISLNSAAAVRASEKNSISTDRKLTMRAFQRAIYEPCTLPLSHPKGGSRREFLHLALPFISSLQVIVDISNLICGLNIASPSLRMTKRPWNGHGHVT